MKKIVDYQSILATCPLFAGAGEELMTMLGCLNGHLLEAKKGRYLLSEGDRVGEIGIVLEGAVQIVKEDYEGNRIILSQVRPGGLFAEAYACAEVPYLPVSVLAAEDSVILMADCQKVVNTCPRSCDHHKRMIANLMRGLAQKNVMLSEKHEIITRRTTREKLMAYLMLEAGKQGAESFDIPYDRQALADYLGVDRSAMSQELGKMQREGLIRTRKNHFELLEHKE